METDNGADAADHSQANNQNTKHPGASHRGKLRDLGKRRAAWMIFDWATQPIYTAGLVFVFAPYFAPLAQEYYLSHSLSDHDADARAQALWFWGQTLAGLMIAALAPLLGSYIDKTGRRMPWMYFFAAVYVGGSLMTWFLYPDGRGLFSMLIIFNISFIAAEFMLVLTNAMLPSLGTPKEIGKISGNGASLGYWGGLLALIVVLLFFAEDDQGKTILGLDPAFGLNADMREGTRFSGPFTALWFAVFMIPFFMWMKDDPNAKGAAADQRQKPVMQKPVTSATKSFFSAIRDLKKTCGDVFARKSLFNFLISSMLYRDALNAIYAAGGIYATLVLDWSIIQLGIFGVIVAIAAAIITQIGGYCDMRFGPRPVIKISIYALIGVCLIIIGLSRDALFGVILFTQGSSAPDIIFYICGSVIGGAGGAIYTASRSMMIRHAHRDRPTEAFGLYALSGKATAFLAPMTIGLVTTLTGSAQFGYLPVVAIFALGLWFLMRVHPKGDSEQWDLTA